MPPVEEVLGERAGAPQSAVIEESSTLPAVTESNWYDAKDDSFDGIEFSDKDKEFKSLGDYVKHTQSLRGMIDKKGVMLPTDDSSEEDRAAFLAAVAPHMGDNAPVVVPEAYEVEVISANEQMTDERKNGVYEGFKGLKLSNDQANGVMALFGEQMAMDGEMLKTASADERTATLEGLKTEFGDGYKDRMAGIDRIAGEESDYMALMEQHGLSGNKLVMSQLDRLARDTTEDQVSTDADLDSVGSIDDQIAKVKSDNGPLLRQGSLNDPARIKVMAQIDQLYARRGTAKV